MDAGDEGEPQADGVPRGGSEGGEERAIRYLGFFIVRCKSNHILWVRERSRC